MGVICLRNGERGEDLFFEIYIEKVWNNKKNFLVHNIHIYFDVFDITTVYAPVCKQKKKLFMYIMRV